MLSLDFSNKPRRIPLKAYFSLHALQDGFIAKTNKLTFSV